MNSKALKIVLDAVLCVVVFFVTMLVGAVISGKLLGTTNNTVNGGSATSLTLLVMAFVVTTAFAIWFYKLLTKAKVTKVQE